MRFFRPLLILALLYALAGAARAQLTSITATSIHSGSGSSVGAGLVTGTLCATAIDGSGNAIPVTVAGGGFYEKGQPFCQALSAGALSGTLSVPNACTDSAPGHGYALQIFNTVNHKVSDPLNVYGVCGTSWSLDTYLPPVSIPITSAFTLTFGSGSPPTSCTPPALDFRTNSGAVTMSLCVGTSFVTVIGTGGEVLLNSAVDQTITQTGGSTLWDIGNFSVEAAAGYYLPTANGSLTPYSGRNADQIAFDPIKPCVAYLTMQGTSPSYFVTVNPCGATMAVIGTPLAISAQYANAINLSDDGNTAYVSAYDTGCLYVLNTATAGSTTLINQVCGLGHPFNVMARSGNTLFVPDWETNPSTLWRVNVAGVTTSVAPTIVDHAATSPNCNASSAYANGNYVYVLCPSEGTSYVDAFAVVPNTGGVPTLTLIDAITTQHSPQYGVVHGQYLYFACHDAQNMHVIDITNPYGMVDVFPSGVFSFAGPVQFMAEQGNLAYIGVGNGGGPVGFYVIDISRPTLPRMVGSGPVLVPDGNPQAIAVHDETLLFTGYGGTWASPGATGTLYRYNLGATFLQQLTSDNIATQTLDVIGLANLGSLEVNGTGYFGGTLYAQGGIFAPTFTLGPSGGGAPVALTINKYDGSGPFNLITQGTVAGTPTVTFSAPFDMQFQAPAGFCINCNAQSFGLNSDGGGQVIIQPNVSSSDNLSIYTGHHNGAYGDLLQIGSNDESHIFFQISTLDDLTGIVTGPDDGTWSSTGLNGVAVGATTPAAGHFTTLSVSSPAAAVTTLTSRSACNTAYQNTTGYNAAEFVALSVPDYGTDAWTLEIGATSSTTTTLIPSTNYPSYNGSGSVTPYTFSFIVPPNWYMQFAGSACTVLSWSETTLPQ